MTINMNIDDFKKVEIKIGEILEAEKIEGSEKLLKLKVNFGEEIRQVVSGIAKNYEPESLIGKQVAFITNLEPRSLMGLESQAMILAVKTENDEFALMVPDKKAAPGAAIK